MTIRKAVRRDKPTWVIDIHYRKKDGTQGRYRKDAQGFSLADARIEERRILALIAQFGEPYEPRSATEEEKPTSITFAEAVILFKRGKAKTNLKHTTRRTYDEILQTRLLPRFGKVRIDELTGSTIEELDASMVEEGRSASRRRNVMIVIRSVLRAALKAKKLPVLPDFPSLPRVGKQILRCLTASQVEAIMAKTNPAARMAFALSAYAGLRAGEVRGLRWVDVDLGGGVLYVRFSRSKGVTSTPKSGHEREVPLATPLAALLRASKGQGEKHVALTSAGHPWGESGLLQAFRRSIKRAGIVGFTLHDLRHFFISEILRRGASAPAAQALAGHEHLETTQRYAHAVRDDLRHAVSLLG